MSLAVGLMLTAVFELFVSADETAKEHYGHLASCVPLVVGVALAIVTLVLLDKWLDASVGPAAEEHCEHSDLSDDRSKHPQPSSDNPEDGEQIQLTQIGENITACLLYTSPSPRDS
eukprot:TRINITY_DN46837_c0_g1_i1.p1 TRINITY_DN46837_c0_g1~~TRINITY_DN46837_c0_g1_i1.p1  ORF type:complete len:116 (+),score=38.03 TRINITY_DN46837_c0_g1_i1:121-468(+)